jgi:hypothetical protein
LIFKNFLAARRPDARPLREERRPEGGFFLAFGVHAESIPAHSAEKVLCDCIHSLLTGSAHFSHSVVA